MATCNVAGRMAASIGGLGPAPPRFEAVETVARGGVLTALPALLQAGLLSHRDRLGPVAGYYGQRAVLLLARVRNPERLCYGQPGEWAMALSGGGELSGYSYPAHTCFACSGLQRPEIFSGRT